MQSGTPIQFDFEINYQSSDGFKFKLLPMRPEDLDKSSEIVTKIFVTREPISMALGCSYEDILPFLGAMTKKSMEQGLGVVAKDEKDNIIGVGVSVDDFLEKQDPIDFSKCGKKALDIIDMLHTSSLHTTPEKPFESINMILVGAEEGLGKKGAKVGSKLIEFSVRSHPCRPKRVWGHTTNPASTKISLNIGCVLKHIYDPKTYANSEGEFVFKDIDIVSKKLFGKPYPGIHIFEAVNLDNSDFNQADMARPKL